MPITALPPTFSITQNPDGTVSTASTANPTSVNWAALLQAIVAALPAIMAIIAAFSSEPKPTPTPTPGPTPIVPVPTKG